MPVPNAEVKVYIGVRLKHGMTLVHQVELASALLLAHVTTSQLPLHYITPLAKPAQHQMNNVI